jgi:peptidoglycan/xylan/chitin deacetylase (PgdA/CDA1 family)
MNPALRSAAERTLLRLGAERAAQRFRSGDTAILAYHNIVPAGTTIWGEKSLHLAQDKFGLQLDALAATHDVLPLDVFFDSRRSLPKRPQAVITFDDAYEGALTVGVDELVKRGLPATIFVAPGLLGTTVWWDKLAARSRGVLPSAARRYALDALGGKREPILRWADVPEDPTREEYQPRIGTEAQVIAAAAKPGIALGAHSWSHPNLTSLTPTELELELSKPLKWLRLRGSGGALWLAYPYGLYNENVASAATSAGYLGALRIDGGLASRSRRAASTALPRINIPAGVSQEGFRLRVIGL